MGRGVTAALLLVACGARTNLGGVVGSDGSLPDSGDASRPPDATTTIDASIHVVCTATTTTALVTMNKVIDQVAVDDHYVYFHTEDGVSRVPKGGGAVELVAAFAPRGAPDLGAFVLDADGIARLQIMPGGAATDVLVGPRQGGNPTTLATLKGTFYGLDAAPTGLYAFGGSDYNRALDLVTTTTTAMPSVPDYAITVAESDGVVYAAADSGVFQLDDVMGVFRIVVSTPGVYAAFLQFDAANLYFYSGNANADEAIVSVPKTGGAITTLLAGPAYSISTFAFDGDHAYVGGKTSGLITRVNKDGSSKAVIGTPFEAEGAMGVAVDDSCVYWAGNTPQPGPTHVYAAPK